MTVRRLLVLAAALVLCGPASANDASDDALGDNADEPYELTPRTATARLAAGGAVVITARFETDVHGPVWHGTSRSITLPPRGVVTGAVVRVGEHVERLQLAKAAAVEDRFTALYSKPGHGIARRWGVRLDSATDALTVGIAAPHRGRVALELTIEVAGCFADDARMIALPETWASTVSGVTPVPASERESVEARCATTHHATGAATWVALPAQALSRQRGGEARIGVSATRLPLPTAHVARVEISIASKLSEVPSDLYSVFVVDHSRSMTSQHAETQRAVIASYIAESPHGRVQLIGYTRTAEALLPGWTAGTVAATRIERVLRGLPPRNGSNVDRGIAAARALLADVRGTRRIVVFTDALLARRITSEVETLGRTATAGTVIHTVDLQGGGRGLLVRSDDAILAPIAAASEGIAMAASVDDRGAIDALPLVRPVSLDNIEITGSGWATDAFGWSACTDALLGESASCSWLAKGAAASGPLTITGMLWGHRVTRVLAPDPTAARSLARMLSVLGTMPAELIAEIETAAHAINTTWSMFATWGHDGGYSDLETWGTCIGGSFSSSSRSSHHLVGVGSAGPKPALELRGQLAAAVRACKPHGTIIANVETTKDEIVDVTVETRDPRDASLSACIADGIWATTLTLTSMPAHATTRIDFDPRS